MIDCQGWDGSVLIPGGDGLEVYRVVVESLGVEWSGFTGFTGFTGF